uniref:Uncharacterized protein n=1 Tax=Trichuris muris TaxID=70415 RepID=A0A5S6QRD3_TRIMR
MQASFAKVSFAVKLAPDKSVPSRWPRQDGEHRDVAVLADPPCTLALGTEALMKLGIGIEFLPDGWRIKRIVWSSPPTLEKRELKGTDKVTREDASEMRLKGKVTSEQPAPSPAVTGRLINEVESVILRPARELPLTPLSAGTLV